MAAVQQWNVRALQTIAGWDRQFDRAIPPNVVQRALDQVGQTIVQRCLFVGVVNRWIDHNNIVNGRDLDWHWQIPIFILKLPLRAVRNILQLAYTIISTAIYTLVHPLKAILLFARMIVKGLYALTLPLTWTQIGAGLVGGSLAQTILTLNLTALIGAGIGALLIVGGTSAGAIQAYRAGPDGAVWRAIGDHLLAIPEALLTGLLLGLLIGGIYKAISYQGPEAHARAYLKEHHLPEPTSITTLPDGSVRMHWTWDEFDQLTKLHPHFTMTDSSGPLTFDLTILPNGWVQTDTIVLSISEDWSYPIIDLTAESLSPSSLGFNPNPGVWTPNPIASRIIVDAGGALPLFKAATE